MATDLGSKGYAPLPQTISNTDTEDEDDKLDEDDMISTDPKDLEECSIVDSSIIYNDGQFLPLDETKNFVNRTRGRQSLYGYSNDNIPIMILDGQTNDDLWRKRDIPLIRCFFLFASILLCIVTIVVFLYVVPCDNSGICPSNTKPKTSVSWDKTLEGIEIHGKITVISGNPANLIFLLRGQQFGMLNYTKAARGEQIPSDGGGVLSMQGTSGIPLWWVKLKRLPTDINCGMIDTDRSGKPDCLISGLGGLLVSIDPIAGTIHWNSEVHTHSDLPMVYMDVDNDEINDLISIEVTNSSLNLVLLNGKSGKLIGRQAIPNCYSIKLRSVDELHNLSYQCFDAKGNYSDNSMSLKIFVKNLSPLYISKKLVLSTTPVPTIIIYPSQISKDSWDLTPFHRLHVQNLGSCPSFECKTEINLSLVNHINETQIWSHVTYNSFVSEPIILDTSTQNYTTGFALKFWQWVGAKRNKDLTKISNASLRNLTERVLIVFVSNTEVNEINASQSEIVQICRNLDCQPNFSRQIHSLSIADLNGDGIFELISYWSSYSTGEKLQSLSSKVQIVKIDEIFETRV